MKSCSTKLIKTDNLKYIDATQLYDNITLHLKRSLIDVFNRVCKQIIVKTRSHYYHLFITDSDYNIYLFNDKHSTIQLELKTLSCDNYYKQGYDLYYVKKVDLYEVYYGATFQMKLPNKFKIVCNASQLTQKKTVLYRYLWILQPKNTYIRGKLVIIYKIHHTQLNEHKETLKQLFHKKEVFIDPSLPIYNI